MLDALFDPRSVAVVGASDDPRKWGNWLARGALKGGDRRSVHLVNRSAAEVLGQPAHASLAAIGAPVELVVAAVPAPALSGVVEEALGIGARAIVAIPSGAALAPALARRVHDAGAVLLGPNCMGVLDSAAELELVPEPMPAGAIGLVSQSGQLAMEVAAFAAAAGLGFSRFASLGDQALLGAAPLVRMLAAHAGTRVVALYLEDFGDGRALLDAAAAARAAGKPVLLLAAEPGAAVTRAARSHTGALASGEDAIAAACAAAGIHRVRTPRELVDVADALLRAPAPRGRRLAVVADGGGHGALAAGLLERAGLAVAELGPAARAAVAALLPAAAAAGNPVDLAGGGERDIRTFVRVCAALAQSGEVDGILLTGFFGGYGGYGEAVAAAELGVARELGREAHASGTPLAVHSMHPDSPAAHALRAAGVPVFGEVERAVRAHVALAADREPPRGVPPLPERGGGEAAAPANVNTRIEGGPVRAGVSLATDRGAGSSRGPAVSAADGGDGPAGGYAAARALFADAGVPLVAGEVVGGDEVVAAAARVGYPVVLKALGTLHKSDAGGVALGLADAGALGAALADMTARLAPPAFAVERMAGDGVELIAGARSDPRFGPLVLVGAGGIHAEVLRDTAVALAPVDAAGAEALLRSLRIAPLLLGARGRPPLDIAAAARAVAALSRLAAAHPELAELEANPLLVTRDGCVALDARIVPFSAATS